MSVSVVIPAHNAAKWIVGALDCLRRQTVTPAKIVVVDDGSQDETADLVRSFGDGVTLLTQHNRGAAVARNRGLEKVLSPFVFFLDADDYVENSFFEAASQALIRARADIAICPVLTEQANGTRTRTFHYDPIPEPLHIFSKWLAHYSQPPCSVVWRTEFLRNIGGWNENVTLNDDGELMMRAMLQEPVLATFDSAYGVYRAHGDPSLSKTRSPVALQGELDALCHLVATAKKKGIVIDFSGFGQRLYIIARGFFELGEWERGRTALAISREMGLERHPGSYGHQILVSILGLETKTRLMRNLRQLPGWY